MSNPKRNARYSRSVGQWTAGALAAMALLSMVASSTAQAQRIRRRASSGYGQHELSGGVGFAADLSAIAPGGFKWFNDYGYRLGRVAWLNLQLNVTAADNGRCFRDAPGRLVCVDSYGNDGAGLELGGGVKLKWRTRRVPLQLHAKFGGAVEMIWHGIYTGTAIAFRSGFGVRYFFVPELSVGAEIVAAVGPAFLRDNLGSALFATLDGNFGVEWRF